MRISVVVCTKDRPDLIGDCLNALSRSRLDNMEILVIDQSAGTATADAVAGMAEHEPRIRYIAHSAVGLSRARNMGIRESTGEVIAFTDDDCIPSPDWAESILREFRTYPQVSAVYGRSLPWTPVRKGERPVAVKADEQPRYFLGRQNPWDVGHGCNMAFRREVFDSVGLFDEVLGPGGALKNCDDADFTYRLLRTGLVIRYSPEPLVYHQQFRHGEELWKLERDYGIGAGAFYSKHLKCGDMYMLKLIFDRWWTAGARHLIYGLLTMRTIHLKLGWYRIAYSVLGMWAARSAKVSASDRIFVDRSWEGRT